MNHTSLTLTAAALLLVTSSAVAFEGTLQLRTTAATESQLRQANGGSAPDTAAIAALPPEQLVRDGGAATRETTVFINGRKVRMDLPLERSGKGYAIIDLDRDVTWFVMPTDRRYIEWTRADAAAVSESAAGMQQSLGKQLAGLPPEQRKQAEAMLKNMQLPAGATPPPDVTLTPIGERRTIHGRTAEGFRATEGDATVIGWVSQDEPELATLMREIAERMERLTPASMRQATATRALQKRGLPVRVQTIYPRRVRIEEIVAVEPKSVAAELFTIPEGYTKSTGRDAFGSAHGGRKP